MTESDRATVDQLAGTVELLASAVTKLARVVDQLDAHRAADSAVIGELRAVIGELRRPLPDPLPVCPRCKGRRTFGPVACSECNGAGVIQREPAG